MAALVDKFSRLADRAKTVPKVLEARADELLLRLDKVEQRGEVFDDMHAHFDTVEEGVGEVEKAMRVIEGNVPVRPSYEPQPGPEDASGTKPEPRSNYTGVTPNPEGAAKPTNSNGVTLRKD